VDDKLILYSFVAGFALNAVIALQMLYYWNSAAPKTKKAPTNSKGPKKPVANTPAAAASTGVSPKPAGKTPSTRRRG
jgi:mannose-P-dolichol utilization defect protein 1